MYVWWPFVLFSCCWIHLDFVYDNICMISKAVLSLTRVFELWCRCRVLSYLLLNAGVCSCAPGSCLPTVYAGKTDGTVCLFIFSDLMKTNAFLRLLAHLDGDHLWGGRWYDYVENKRHALCLFVIFLDHFILLSFLQQTAAFATSQPCLALTE